MLSTMNNDADLAEPDVDADVDDLGGAVVVEVDGDVGIIEPELLGIVACIVADMDDMDDMDAMEEEEGPGLGTIWPPPTDAGALEPLANSAPALNESNVLEPAPLITITMPALQWLGTPQ